jgi:hypothetical protein
MPSLLSSPSNTFPRQLLRILKQGDIITSGGSPCFSAFAPCGSRISAPPFAPPPAPISPGTPACRTAEHAPMPPGVRTPLSFRGTMLLSAERRVGAVGRRARDGPVKNYGPRRGVEVLVRCGGEVCPGRDSLAPVRGEVSRFGRPKDVEDVDVTAGELRDVIGLRRSCGWRGRACSRHSPWLQPLLVPPATSRPLRPAHMLPTRSPYCS